ncbi:hypothetical protein CVT26_004336 [Gymnopilus dilepis]|uniref:G-protein coupled receptors family 1 profile domain-containing protein n=1 Tax=Gymnopilus dilepis TaxID=231916 RepID=A0A409W280_9AGAR|nr:hypothetical protein CVT26_004336 [Gymnopilus dilepis]
MLNYFQLRTRTDDEQELLMDMALVRAINTAAIVDTLLYGIHIPLFFICIFIFVQNRRTSNWFIVASAIIMFGLSTVDAAFTLRFLTHDLFELVQNPTNLAPVGRWLSEKTPLFVTNNFVADLVLLYRCYMVWGKSRYILLGASLLVLLDSVWGYLGLGESLTERGGPFVPLYIWSIFVINVILASVTIGRVVWVARIAKKVFGKQQLASYRAAIALLVESSFVYSTVTLAYALVPSSAPQRMILMTTSMRLVAIMPTLLIVQVGLGRALVVRESKTTGIETLDFGDHLSSSAVVDPSVSSRFSSDRTTGRSLDHTQAPQ